jgi:hypothetical protein
MPYIDATDELRQEENGSKKYFIVGAKIGSSACNAILCKKMTDAVYQQVSTD